jgi:uncharacterized membrane protein
MQADTPTPRQTFLRDLQKYLVTGLLVLGPISITLWLLWKVFRILDGILGRMINLVLRDALQVSVLGDRPIPGLGLIGLLILLIFTGYAAHRTVGRWLIRRGTLLIKQIPLMNRIYQALDQISQAIFSGKREVFKRAVLIEYPRSGVYSLGIVTAESGGPVQKAIAEEVVSVFIISTPNPTTGFLVFLPRKDVIYLDIPVEEALKLIISGGVISALDANQTAPH